MMTMNVSYETFAPRSAAQITRLQRIAALTAGPSELAGAATAGAAFCLFFKRYKRCRVFLASRRAVSSTYCDFLGRFGSGPSPS